MKLEELKEWLDYSQELRDYYERSPNSDPSDPMTSWLEPPPPYSVHNYDRKLSLFRGYLQTMEEFLEQERQERDQELKDESKKFTKHPDYDDPSELFRLQEMVEVVDEFADTFRKSFLVNLYSFWESQLFPLCNSLKHYDDIKHYDDMPSQEKKKKNFGHLNAYPFLEKLGFEISKVPNDEKKNKWKLDGVLKDIDNYRIVRNCIVHNAGYPDEAKDEEKLREYIKDESLLSLDEDESIQLCQEFYEKTLKTIEKYFDELLKNLAKWDSEQRAS